MDMNHTTLFALAALAALGIVTSTVYSLMVAAGAVRYRLLAGGPSRPPIIRR